MTRKEFDKIFQMLKSEIKYDTNGYWLIEENDYIYDNKIEVEEVYSDVIDQGRWSITKDAVFRIGGEYFISVVWDDPATEMQEGQDTNCEIYEVEPFEKTIIEYKVIK